MKFLPVQSKKLIALGYNPDTRNCVAQFGPDDYYLYEHVDHRVIILTLYADSVGKAFVQFIERKHSFRKTTIHEAQNL